MKNRIKLVFLVIMFLATICHAENQNEDLKQDQTPNNGTLETADINSNKIIKQEKDSKKEFVSYDDYDVGFDENNIVVDPKRNEDSLNEIKTVDDSNPEKDNLNDQKIVDNSKPNEDSLNSQNTVDDSNSNDESLNNQKIVDDFLEKEKLNNQESENKIDVLDYNESDYNDFLNGQVTDDLDSSQSNVQNIEIIKIDISKENSDDKPYNEERKNGFNLLYIFVPVSTIAALVLVIALAIIFRKIAINKRNGSTNRNNPIYKQVPTNMV